MSKSLYQTKDNIFCTLLFYSSSKPFFHLVADSSSASDSYILHFHIQKRALIINRIFVSILFHFQLKYPYHHIQFIFNYRISFLYHAISVNRIVASCTGKRWRFPTICLRKCRCSISPTTVICPKILRPPPTTTTRPQPGSVMLFSAIRTSSPPPPAQIFSISTPTPTPPPPPTLPISGFKLPMIT